MSTTVTLTVGDIKAIIAMVTVEDIKAIIAMVWPPTYLQRSQRGMLQQEQLLLQGEIRGSSWLLPSALTAGFVLACSG